MEDSPHFACDSRTSDKTPSNQEEFEGVRKAELEGSVENGTFRKVHARDINPSYRISRSHFVDEIEKADKRVRLKSKLIAQNCNDEGGSEIATKAPTVQRCSQHLAMTIAAWHAEMTVYIHEFMQAYVQSK